MYHYKTHYELSSEFHMKYWGNYHIVHTLCGIKDDVWGSTEESEVTCKRCLAKMAKRSPAAGAEKYLDSLYPRMGLGAK